MRESIEKVNPKAIVIDGASPIKVDDSSLIKGKRVLVVEDGPTLTHGEMKIGAGIVARVNSAQLNWLIHARPLLAN